MPFSFRSVLLLHCWHLQLQGLFCAGFYDCILGIADIPIPIPLERWDMEQTESGTAEGVGDSTLRFACLVEDITSFDGAFFRISQHEADGMDPQQRLLLEQAHSALWVRLVSWVGLCGICVHVCLLQSCELITLSCCYQVHHQYRRV